MGKPRCTCSYGRGALCSALALLTATSEDEVNMWIKGLTWLMEDTLQAATPLQIER